MRLAALAIICVPHLLHADTSAPAPSHVQRCAAILEAARATLVDEGFRELNLADVSVDEKGVTLSVVDGHCMRHLEIEVSVRPSATRSGRWREQNVPDGFTRTRNGRGYRGEIRVHAKNESESGSSDEEISRAVEREMTRAIDRCLR